MRRKLGLVAALIVLGACSATQSDQPMVDTETSDQAEPSTSVHRPVTMTGTARSTSSGRPVASPSSSTPAGPRDVTISFAGDVNFAEHTADRLIADPATVFGVAAPGLRKADLTMVNLETAVTTGGDPAPKQFHFRTPPAAFDALLAAGIDVVTMANNHAADYGSSGLADTLQAITVSKLRFVGIGADAEKAYAPQQVRLGGQRFAIFAASQVHDYTQHAHTASSDTPGIADADADLLVQNVSAAARAGKVPVVYLHWGIEYESCPSAEQAALADRLATAGAAAVVGSHAHGLQGAGWRDDGTFVAYGLGNFLWWRTFGTNQDDTGVLTLTFREGAVVASSFVPARIDETGVPVPATGETKTHILNEWDAARECAHLAARR